MKFSCDRSLLMSALNTVTKALTQRSNIPVLEGILLTAEGRQVTLACTDMSLTIEADIAADVFTTGRAVVPGRFFTEIVRKLPEGEVTLKDEAGGRSSWCGGSRITLMGLPAEEFPKLPSFNKSVGFKMEQKLLKQMINQTIFAVAPEGYIRQVLTGCLFDFSDGLLTVAALDTVRLAVRTAEVGTDNQAMKAIIPSGALNETSKILADDDSEAEISFQGSNCLFDLGNSRVFTRLYEGEFLKYRSFIPVNYDISIIADRGALLESIDRAWLMVRENNRNNHILFSMGGGKLVITSRSDTGDVYEELPVSGDTSELKIAFNAKYFVDCLKNMDEDFIKLKFTTNRSPCVITPVENENKLYLILPVKM